MTAETAAAMPLAAWGHAPELDEVSRRLDRRLQVVLGKGGVGRTLIASALAKRAADAGRRTLLLEVDAPDSAARQLRVRPAVDEPREVLNNLWLCRMTPAGAMKEYALMTLRFQALYRLVFENSLVKYFLKSIPSLGEFTMLGKLWHHATEERPQGGPRFDRVIVDAPATGHAITFLSLARLVADIAPPGILADKSLAMAELVEDHGRSCFHLVTIPEEMPVNEALELHQASQQRLRMAPGVAFINRLAVPLLTDEQARWAAGARASAGPALAPFLDVSAARRLRERGQRVHAARFVRGIDMPWMTLPERGADDPTDHKFVDDIGRAIDAFEQGKLTELALEDAA